jgi:DNA-directed RNA polymerase specialized sigma24 family protein
MTTFTKPTNFTENDFWTLEEAMLLLSNKQKDVLLMRFWLNMSINEISRSIGMSWDATDRFIDSAVNHLKIRFFKIIKEEGGTVPDNVILFPLKKAS